MERRCTYGGFPQSYIYSSETVKKLNSSQFWHPIKYTECTYTHRHKVRKRYSTFHLEIDGRPSESDNLDSIRWNLMETLLLLQNWFSVNFAIADALVHSEERADEGYHCVPNEDVIRDIIQCLSWKDLLKKFRFGLSIKQDGAPASNWLHFTYEHYESCSPPLVGCLNARCQTCGPSLQRRSDFRDVSVLFPTVTTFNHLFPSSVVLYWSGFNHTF